MYRYDEFDQKVVDERVEQFRGQVARRLSGELTEDQFKPLRLMNGLYLQLHAYMLRVAIPYGTLSSRQLRMLAHIARKYDKDYAPFHHAPEPPIQLAQARRHSRHLGRPRDGRDARHPDQRQLHPQRDVRSLRRRRRRRSRRPARLVGNHPPVVDVPPRILVPAAQVQDRGDGSAKRPRRNQSPRHRHRHPPRRVGHARLRRLCRRRARPHAVRRPPDRRRHRGGRFARLSRSDDARLQSVRPPRQSLQIAHQNSRASNRRRRNAPPSRRRIRRGQSARRARPAPGRDRSHPSLFRGARVRNARRRRRIACQTEGAEQGVRRLARHQRRRHTKCRATPSSRSR